MAVYVDELIRTEPSKRWPYVQACHMRADTSLELDDMAAALGLDPRWKQRPLTPLEHYDLTRAMRARAVRLGAVEMTRREMAQHFRMKESADEQP